MERFLLLAIVIGGYFLFQRRMQARRAPPDEVAARATATVPPLLLMTMMAEIGHRAWPGGRGLLGEASIDPGWIAGVALGVLLSDRVQRAVLRIYGLAPLDQER